MTVVNGEPTKTRRAFMSDRALVATLQGIAEDFVRLLTSTSRMLSPSALTSLTALAMAVFNSISTPLNAEISLAEYPTFNWADLTLRSEERPVPRATGQNAGGLSVNSCG